MIAKLVLLFLVIMGVLGMFGGWRVKSARRLQSMRDKMRLDARKCPRCGRFAVGAGPCICEEGKH